MVQSSRVELRPFSGEDREPVLSALAERDREDFGNADFTREVVSDLWRAGDGRAVVALEGAAVLGFASVHPGGTVAFVDPRREGEGVGSALLGWAEARALESGHGFHRQWLPEHNAAARRLLADAGYRQMRAILQMSVELGSIPEPPPTPTGIELSTLDVERDARALHEADAAAFMHNADYRPESYETFYEMHLTSPSVDPSLSFVARRGEAVAGFTVCRRWPGGVGYIDLLAVVEDERRRGLGAALLLTAFAALRRAGDEQVVLDVASDNAPALHLYESVGMAPGHRVRVFEKPTSG